MGYSITREQYERSEALRREGRQCSVSTGRGGCFNRATYESEQEFWAYKLDDGPGRPNRMTYCSRHAREFQPGYEGVNFRVLTLTKF